METLEGTEFLGWLPDSEHKWEMRSFEDSIIFCNPDHPPMILKDGELRVLELGETDGMATN